MEYYLSVDSGGTKTAFVLCDESGNKVFDTILGPANYLVNGLDNVIKLYHEGFNNILKATNLKEEDITSCFIAMAGFGDIPDEIKSITKKIKDEFPNINISLGNDTENALAGSLLGQEGIHIIAGTGSIGIGRDLDNKLYRSGGWHHLFGGDEGSGYWIGAKMIQHFTKQADNREAKTYLYNYLIDKYNLCNAENILNLVITRWEGQRDKIASMSKDAYECAVHGDKVALSIFKEAAQELAMIVNAIYKIGNFSEKIYVSYSGGVFNCLDLFKDVLNKSIIFEHELIKPQLEPLAGGIILAMQNNKKIINNKILENLKNI